MKDLKVFVNWKILFRKWL